MTEKKYTINEAKELLKIHWSFDKFRPGQERAIQNALDNKSTVVIMPTGGGKSLCFQLPALLLPGVTIVISPLIALMKDQVDSMTRLGVPATFINSSISADEAHFRLEAVKRGEYKLLYIAPERFSNNDFAIQLSKLKVSLFAIDEAHCISQWGHDFRPSYLRLKRSIALCGNPPVMALTATATPEVRKDIIRQLGLDKSDLVITGFARPNLQFGVLRANESRKPSLVIDAVKSASAGSGIIYASTRARVDSLMQTLVDCDIEAAAYHAGMDSEDRKWVQNRFLSGEVKVIVATNAFGLGIDKADVRFVIHYDMPGTLEAYYQEAGRAGRDGKHSFCLLMFNSRDRALHEFFIKGDNPPPEMILNLYDVLLSYESDILKVTYAELMESMSDKVPDMAVGTALKILENEGYIARNRERKGEAFIKLYKKPEYILDTISPRAKKQRELFEQLSGRFADDLMRGWNYSPQEIADILEVKREGLARLIKKLSDAGLAEYRPPFKGTEIRILKRVDLDDLEFDRKAMKEKLKAAYRKLDKMEDYVYYDDCRQKYILNYFGEKDAKRCQHCDICLTDNKIDRIFKKQSLRRGSGLTDNSNYRSKSKFKSSDKFMSVQAPNKKAGLGTKLTQLETLELFNKGLSIEQIALKREVSASTIVNHICFLIEKKLIKDVEKVVSLKKQKMIKEAIEQVGKDKLKPIKEMLGDKISYDEIKIVLAFL